MWAGTTRDELVEPKLLPQPSRKWKKEKVLVSAKPYLGHYRYRLRGKSRISEKNQMKEDGIDSVSEGEISEKDDIVIGAMPRGTRNTEAFWLKNARHSGSKKTDAEAGARERKPDDPMDGTGGAKKAESASPASSDDDVMVLCPDGWTDAKKLPKRKKKKRSKRHSYPPVYPYGFPPYGFAPMPGAPMHGMPGMPPMPGMPMHGMPGMPPMPGMPMHGMPGMAGAPMHGGPMPVLPPMMCYPEAMQARAPMPGRQPKKKRQKE